MAQRLIRTICNKCKKNYEISRKELEQLTQKMGITQDIAGIINQEKIKLYKGEGCSVCNGTGFKGRSSIAEAMEVSDNIKKLILKNASPKEMEETAKQEGMVTMFEDGIQKVLQGVTTLEEILRVMRT